MLDKFIATLVEKYSFVDKCYVKGIKFTIKYSNKGKPFKKELPIRATVNQLKRTLKRIERKAGGSKFGKSKNEIYWF